MTEAEDPNEPKVRRMELRPNTENLPPDYFLKGEGDPERKMQPMSGIQGIARHGINRVIGRTFRMSTLAGKLKTWYERNGTYAFPVGALLEAQSYSGMYGEGEPMGPGPFEVVGYADDGDYLLSDKGSMGKHNKWNVEYHLKRKRK